MDFTHYVATHPWTWYVMSIGGSLLIIVPLAWVLVRGYLQSRTEEPRGSRRVAQMALPLLSSGMILVTLASSVVGAVGARERVAFAFDLGTPLLALAFLTWYAVAMYANLRREGGVWQQGFWLGVSTVAWLVVLWLCVGAVQRHLMS